MLVGGVGRMKCVFRACLCASWKGALQLTGRTRQKRNERAKNEQNTPSTGSAWATELTHTVYRVKENRYWAREGAWARPCRPNTLKVSDSKGGKNQPVGQQSVGSVLMHVKPTCGLVAFSERGSFRVAALQKCELLSSSSSLANST